MGYIFLLIALIAGGIKCFCGKKVSGIVNEFRDTLLVNCIRMIVCTAIGLIVLFGQGEIQALLPEGRLMLLAAAGGIFTTAFVVSWLFAVKQNAYMLVEVFLMLGVVVTVFMSYLVYGEPVSTREGLGILLLLIAIAVMQMQRIKVKISTILVMILCGTVNGLSDFTQKAYMKGAAEASVAAFQLYTYIFSALSMIIFLVMLKVIKSKKCKKILMAEAEAIVQKKSEKIVETDMQTVLRKSYKYILVMSLCLYLNSYFKTLAAGVLPAALMYPLMQGTSLLIATSMAVLLFKEKLTVRMVCGIVLAFIALLLINL